MEYLGPGVCFLITEDSGDIEEEFNTFIGEIPNGRDSVSERFFGFNVKLDNVYAGG